MAPKASKAQAAKSAAKGKAKAKAKASLAKAGQHDDV